MDTAGEPGYPAAVPLRLYNPYDGCFPAVKSTGGLPGWIRGNLHGHSKEHSSCSSVPLARSVEQYASAGAGFLAVTDHDHVTDLSGERQVHPEMVFLEGFEYSSDRNVLFIGERVPSLAEIPLPEAMARAEGLLTIVCHPQPRRSEEYWTADDILALQPAPVAVEIYNGHYSRGHPLWRDTNPLYTDIWDELLTCGARTVGVANDDFHDPPDFGRAWNMVFLGERSPRAVLEAVAAGRCYATTGLLLDGIVEDGQGIEITLADEATGRFIGPGGRVLDEARGRSFQWRGPVQRYARFEARGRAGSIWLQPFFPGVLDTPRPHAPSSEDGRKEQR